MIQKRKDHADHNYDVCIHLHERGGADDWVVTTAFYSTLHYMQAHIFPFRGKLGGETVMFSNFEDYCEKKGIERGKHWETRKLIEAKLRGPMAAKYNRLLDMSWTARYRDYKQSPKSGDFAVRTLKALRKECGFE